MNPYADRWNAALAAYRNGTAGELDAHNTYRWLVQNHDGNNQHRGMQPSCPVCVSGTSEERNR